VIPRLKWDDSYRPDRGRVLTAEELKAMDKFHRYLGDHEPDFVAPRTLPGVHPKGAFFTRGSGHNKYGGYTENPDEYQEVVDRLAKKHQAAADKVPAPVILNQEGATVGLVSLGGCDAALREAVYLLKEQGIVADYMRVRGFPFSAAVVDFLNAHEMNYVVEQNRDAQLKTLLISETSVYKRRLDSVLIYGGFPLSARPVVEQLVQKIKQKNEQKTAQSSPKGAA
jgi:2-oxoglutarate ferredoxin oxidoreductase subunit alpha